MDALEQLEQAHQEVLKLNGSGFAASLLSEARRELSSAPSSARVNWRVVSLCVAILCAVSMLAGVLAAGVVPRVPTVDSEREYYRGVFDACGFLFGYFTGGADYETTIRSCNELHVIVRGKGWYQSESDGFEYK